MDTLKCIHNVLTGGIFVLFCLICFLVNKCCCQSGPFSDIQCAWRCLQTEITSHTYVDENTSSFCEVCCSRKPCHHQTHDQQTLDQQTPPDQQTPYVISPSESPYELSSYQQSPCNSLKEQEINYVIIRVKNRDPNVPDQIFPLRSSVDTCYPEDFVNIKVKSAEPGNKDQIITIRNTPLDSSVITSSDIIPDPDPYKNVSSQHVEVRVRALDEYVPDKLYLLRRSSFYAPDNEMYIRIRTSDPNLPDQLISFRPNPNDYIIGQIATMENEFVVPVVIVFIKNASNYTEPAEIIVVPGTGYNPEPEPPPIDLDRFSCEVGSICPKLYLQNSSEIIEKCLSCQLVYSKIDIKPILSGENNEVSSKMKTCVPCVVETQTDVQVKHSVETQVTSSESEEIIEHTVKIKVSVRDCTSKTDVKTCHEHTTPSGTKIFITGPICTDEPHIKKVSECPVEECPETVTVRVPLPECMKTWEEHKPQYSYTAVSSGEGSCKSALRKFEEHQYSEYPPPQYMKDMCVEVCPQYFECASVTSHVKEETTEIYSPGYKKSTTTASTISLKTSSEKLKPQFNKTSHSDIISIKKERVEFDDEYKPKFKKETSCMDDAICTTIIKEQKLQKSASDMSEASVSSDILDELIDCKENNNTSEEDYMPLQKGCTGKCKRKKKGKLQKNSCNKCKRKVQNDDDSCSTKKKVLDGDVLSGDDNVTEFPPVPENVTRQLGKKSRCGFVHSRTPDLQAKNARRRSPCKRIAQSLRRRINSPPSKPSSTSGSTITCLSEFIPFDEEVDRPYKKYADNDSNISAPSSCDTDEYTCDDVIKFMFERYGPPPKETVCVYNFTSSSSDSSKETSSDNNKYAQTECNCDDVYKLMFERYEPTPKETVGKTVGLYNFTTSSSDNNKYAQTESNCDDIIRLMFERYGPPPKETVGKTVGLYNLTSCSSDSTTETSSDNNKYTQTECDCDDVYKLMLERYEPTPKETVGKTVGLYNSTTSSPDSPKETSSDNNKYAQTECNCDDVIKLMFERYGPPPKETVSRTVGLYNSTTSSPESAKETSSDNNKYAQTECNCDDVIKLMFERYGPPPKETVGKTVGLYNSTTTSPDSTKETSSDNNKYAQTECNCDDVIKLMFERYEPPPKETVDKTVGPYNSTTSSPDSTKETNSDNNKYAQSETKIATSSGSSREPSSEQYSDQSLTPNEQREIGMNNFNSLKDSKAKKLAADDEDATIHLICPNQRPYSNESKAEELASDDEDATIHLICPNQRPYSNESKAKELAADDEDATIHLICPNQRPYSNESKAEELASDDEDATIHLICPNQRPYSNESKAKELASDDEDATIHLICPNQRPYSNESKAKELASDDEDATIHLICPNQRPYSNESKAKELASDDEDATIHLICPNQRPYSNESKAEELASDYEDATIHVICPNKRSYSNESKAEELASDDEDATIHLICPNQRPFSNEDVAKIKLAFDDEPVPILPKKVDKIPKECLSNKCVNFSDEVQEIDIDNSKYISAEEFDSDEKMNNVSFISTIERDLLSDGDIGEIQRSEDEIRCSVCAQELDPEKDRFESGLKCQACIQAVQAICAETNRTDNENLSDCDILGYKIDPTIGISSSKPVIRIRPRSCGPCDCNEYKIKNVSPKIKIVSKCNTSVETVPRDLLTNSNPLAHIKIDLEDGQTKTEGLDNQPKNTDKSDAQKHPDETNTNGIKPGVIRIRPRSCGPCDCNEYKINNVSPKIKIVSKCNTSVETVSRDLLTNSNPLVHITIDLEDGQTKTEEPDNQPKNIDKSDPQKHTDETNTKCSSTGIQPGETVLDYLNRMRQNNIIPYPACCECWSRTSSSTFNCSTPKTASSSAPSTVGKLPSMFEEPYDAPCTSSSTRYNERLPPMDEEPEDLTKCNVSIDYSRRSIQRPKRNIMKYFSDGPSTSGVAKYGKFYPYRRKFKRPMTEPTSQVCQPSSARFPCPSKNYYTKTLPKRNTGKSHSTAADQRRYRSTAADQRQVNSIYPKVKDRYNANESSSGIQTAFKFSNRPTLQDNNVNYGEDSQEPTTRLWYPI